MLVDGEAAARTARASLLLYYLASTFNALSRLHPDCPPPLMSGLRPGKHVASPPPSLAGLGAGTTFASRTSACEGLLLEHEQVLASIEAAGDILGGAVD